MFEQFRWGWLISFPSFQHDLMNSFLRNFLLEIFKRYIPNVYELVPQPTGLADSWHPFNWYHHMKCILHPHHFLSLSAFPTHFLTFPIISFRTCSFPFTLLSILSPSSLHPLLPLLPVRLGCSFPSPPNQPFPPSFRLMDQFALQSQLVPQIQLHRWSHLIDARHGQDQQSLWMRSLQVALNS